MSVKNFSPELLNIYKVGSQREFEFDCGTEKAAMALRARLHNLRRELRKERHWLTTVAEGVVISIPKDRPTFIIAHPPDNDILPALREALKAQGIESEDENERKKFADESDKPMPRINTRKDDLPENDAEKAENAIRNYLGKDMGQKRK